MRKVEPETKSHGHPERPAGLLAVARADPAAVLQRPLGGFPCANISAEQVILTWLMTLPPEVKPPHAARSLLAGRLPCCRTTPPATGGRLRELLQFIALHRRVTSPETDEEGR